MLKQMKKVDIKKIKGYYKYNKVDYDPKNY